jgi:hypothetical protein
MMAGIDFSMPENFFNDEDDFGCFGTVGFTKPVVIPPPPMQPSSQLPAVELYSTPTPPPLTAEMNNSSDNFTNSTDLNQDGLFVASLPITDEDSVNLYMFFDPIQQAVVCPRQTITFQTGNVVSTAVVGPMVIQQAQLESLFDAAKNLSSAHLNALPSSSPPMTMTNT